MGGLRIRSEGPGVLDRPEVDVEQSSGSGKGGWIVTVYNNETNTFAEVEHILMVATGCDYEEAWMETWEIDRLGKSVVHHSDQEECENVAAVIAQIGIEVRVSCE